MIPWFLYHDNAHAASWNMACDEVLLEQFQSGKISCPVLRLYEFEEPSVTIGYGMRSRALESQSLPVPIVRRFTGGGWVEHKQDLVYSLVARPVGLFKEVESSYALIHQAIQAAFLQFNLNVTLTTSEASTFYFGKPCFKTPVHSDILLEGKKIAGAAQRRFANCLLHQGSIDWSCLKERVKQNQWIEVLKLEFSKLLQSAWVPFDENPVFLDEVQQKEKDKYATLEWNMRI
jgi:lipoate-protein ligase A